MAPVCYLDAKCAPETPFEPHLGVACSYFPLYGTCLLQATSIYCYFERSFGSRKFDHICKMNTVVEL